MASPKFASIEDYLASLDSTKAQTLREIIDSILEQFPELQSKIAWSMPTIHRRGKYVAAICAFKHHLNFAPFSPQIVAAFKPRLVNYVVLEQCFRVPVDWKVDHDLLRDLVVARLIELD